MTFISHPCTVLSSLQGLFYVFSFTECVTTAAAAVSPAEWLPLCLASRNIPTLDLSKSETFVAFQVY